MSSTTWTPRAVASEAREWRERAWRVVEAQHVASTMKLVDSSGEQEILEDLLESGKPVLPGSVSGLHFLLATPFRYPPPPGGSRFRGDNDPGVFYAGETIRTACAELGYWRWRFLLDAPDLAELGPVPHTAFLVRICTQVADLRLAPFAEDAACWSDPSDYGACQAFSRVAREAGLGAILYRSVRDPEVAWCVAVLMPDAFESRFPEPELQTWWLVVRRTGVTWTRAPGESHAFSASAWIEGKK